MKILLSIGGASGSIYGIRLLQELNKAKAEVHLIVSGGAKKIIEHETNYKFNDLKKKLRLGIDVFVQYRIAGLVQNAIIHSSCMQIDTAVILMLLGVESHWRPPLV